MGAEKLAAARQLIADRGLKIADDDRVILYARLEIAQYQFDKWDKLWIYERFQQKDLARLEREQLIAWRNGAFYNPVDMAIIRQKREKWERKDNAV